MSRRGVVVRSEGLRALRILPSWLGATSAAVAALVATVCAPGTAWAQAYSEEAVEAAYLYRFAGYIEWPKEDTVPPRFTIAVLGADGVAEELGRLLPGHPVKGRAAQVRAVRTPHEVGDAQMLYVGPGHAGELRSVIAALGRRPVLVVSDEEHGLEDGAALNFIVIDQRVRFEVSLPAAERSGLRISSELLSVAARVQGQTLRRAVSLAPVPGTP